MLAGPKACGGRDVEQTAHVSAEDVKRDGAASVVATLASCMLDRRLIMPLRPVPLTESARPFRRASSVPFGNSQLSGMHD